MAENQMKLQIITPDRIFFDGMINKAIFKGAEGDMGILYDHIPLTTLIETCMFKFYQKDKEKVIAVHGGFVEIQEDKINVLTDVAEWPHEIDLERAKQAQKRAEERIERYNDDVEINLVRAKTSLRKALTRIETVEYLSSRK